MTKRCNIAFVLLLAACRTDPKPAADAAPATTAVAPPFGESTSQVDPYDPDAALGARIEALFSTCGGGPETACHARGEGGTMLRLGADGDLVNVPSTQRPDLVRVRPYDPPRSYLYLKVLGDGGIDGGRMPLDDVQDLRTVDLVASWIEAGAPAP